MTDDGRRRAEYPINVAFVSALFPPALGGTERQAENLAGKLKEEGLEVTVYTQKLKGYDSLGNDAGVHRLAPAAGGRLASFLFGMRLLFRLLLDRPDVIQVFLLSSPAFFAGLAGRMVGAPVVARLGGGGRYGDLATSRERLLSRLRLKCVLVVVNRFVSPSLSSTAGMAALGVSEARCTIIPNGVDLSRFKRTEDERDPSAAVTVLFAGRLEEGKGLLTLLGAWAEVCRRVQGVRLLIIGKGRLLPRLEQETTGLGLDDSVDYVGPVDHKDMVSWYNRASIFVLPSFSEGLSNALLEAMACGLAPVASDIPANRDLAGDAAALFFPPGDEKALAGALKYLLENGEKRRGLARRAEDRSRIFSLEAAVRSYMRLYEEMAGSRV